ncbi:MAG: hypothetical protein U0175_32815 [Caldilineaceae bacterium]
MSNLLARHIAQTEISDRIRSSIEAIPVSVPRISTIKQLLTSLDSFADEMTGFFKDGFAPTPNVSYRLVKSPSKSEEFVYGRIADRVNYDLDVIHRAFGQRYIDQSSTRFSEKVGNRLQIADSLAMRALQLIRSKQNQTEMTTSVLTYCQRYLRTRVLPYTRVAPLAIPMSALRYDLDLTAIAHEVGHHAYRYLELYQPTTLKQFMNTEHALPSMLKAWMEEIFADVYGGLIAGPLILTCFMEFALQTPDKWFAADDGQHPPPMLRPYIYIDLLSKLSQRLGIDLGDMAASKTDWTRKVNERGYNDNTPLDSGGSNPDLLLNTLTMGEAQEKIASLTDNILDYFAPTAQDQWWMPISNWNTFSSMSEVIEQVGNWEPIQLDDVSTQARQDAFESYVVDNPDKDEGVSTVGEILAAAGNEIPVREWMKILSFGDWVEVVQRANCSRYVTLRQRCWPL